MTSDDGGGSLPSTLNCPAVFASVQLSDHMRAMPEFSLACLNLWNIEHSTGLRQAITGQGNYFSTSIETLTFGGATYLAGAGRMGITW